MRLIFSDIIRYESIYLSVLILLVFVTPRMAKGQIAYGGSPYAYKYKSAPLIPFVVMPPVDNEAMIARDSYTWHKSEPYRFGEKSEADLGPDNSGIWSILDNGDRIWNLGIRSVGAFSLNLVFSQYDLPPGARVFIYSEDKSEFIGGFDHRNNKAHGSLATSLFRGESVIIEYFEPLAVKGTGKLRVGSITHAYRDLFKGAKSLIPGFGAADPCTININCPQGDEWQAQSRSVVMLMVNSSGFCSGTLVNNSENDGTPYVLTAEHCIGKMDGSSIIALFNYESPVCDNSYPTLDHTISGSVIRAKSVASDFALLEMSEAPPAAYNANYTGWSRSSNSPTRFICIGHPSGDIKKWNEETPNGRERGYWWTSPRLNAGQTEYGSSGSGVWDQNGRLVGQLYGGDGWCNDVDSTNYWGRFDRSWTGGGEDTSRLKDWLDPLATETMFLDHFDPNASSDPEVTFQLNMTYVEDLIEGGAVSLHLEKLEKPVVMVDPAGEGIYTCRLNFKAGDELKYYYSYQNGSDTVFDYLEEREALAGGECADPEAYRTLTVEARNQTLPAVLFGSCLVYPELPEITFQVDLSELTDMFVGGGAWVSFGNWESWWVMKDVEGDGIYSATGLLEPGSKIKYFFGYQTGPDENSDYTGERQQLGGLECANALGYRSLTVPGEDLALPSVVYGTCEETTSGVNMPGSVKKVNLYYDAISDQLRVSCAADVQNISIFNLTGQKLISISTGGQENIGIFMNTLQKGVYIVHLSYGMQGTHGMKFLK